MSDILAIDIMNHPSEATRGTGQDSFQYREFQIMLQTTFKTALKKKEGQGAKGDKIDRSRGILAGHASVSELIADMDRLGYDRIMIVATKMWSYYYHHKLIVDYSVDDVAKIVEQSNGRLLGGAGYNPLRIDESLRELERGVKEFGFKYIWFHPISFGLAPDDRRCYPLYAKCVELDIAVGLQVGQSAEVLPSDVGRPMLVDCVAIDFPTLRINLSHTGWPWVDEWCSMLWRHPNVYGDISAYLPRGLDERQVRFMDSSRGRNKVLFGTNGLGLEVCKKQFLELPIKDETKCRVLRDNAIDFLKIS